MMCMGASRGAEKSEYWAFRPLSPAKVPPVEGNSWARNAIDHFILARAQVRMARAQAKVRASWIFLGRGPRSPRPRIGSEPKPQPCSKTKTLI